MRLKTMDGPLCIYNGNNISKSAKRINTFQNSNVTTNYSSVTANYNNISDVSNNTSEDVANILTHRVDLNILNYVAQKKLQWRKPHQQEVKKRQLTKNANNKNNQLLIIDNTLAAFRKQTMHEIPSSACSELSSDDSFFDYEEAAQSYPSTDVSPHDEACEFDIFDLEPYNNGNQSNRDTLHRKRILNPNYSNFPQLTYSLDCDVNILSNTDYVDDDFEYDSLTDKLKEAKENNDNNNAESTDSQVDNLLENTQNTQKVFYDKLDFNIEDSSSLDQEVHDRSNDLNTKIEKKALSLLGIQKETVRNISEGPKSELSRLILDTQSNHIFEDMHILPNLGKAVVHELDKTIETIQVIEHLQLLALKFNVERSFNKLPLLDSKYSYIILKDSKAIINFYLMSKRDDIPSHLNSDMPKILYPSDEMKSKVTDAFLSNAQENLLIPVLKKNTLDGTLRVSNAKMIINDAFNEPNAAIKEESNRELKEIKHHIKCKYDSFQDFSCKTFCEENGIKECKETGVPRENKQKKEKVEYGRNYSQPFDSLITFPRRDTGNQNKDLVLGSITIDRQKRKSTKSLGSVDVCNIETAMPKIDMEAIEVQLRAAREEEVRRKTDREEIRRRLAMGSEDDYHADRPGRKPSLQARLQSGMNLQICFMNETVSDNESPSIDSDCPTINSKQSKTSKPKLPKLYTSYQDKLVPVTRPVILPIDQSLSHSVKEPIPEADFSTRQARLQTEARMALAQAKEMARMQMEIERQRQKKSPITEMVRHSLEKVGIPFSENKRRLSRQILTEMNVAQLQVIVNDLHTQIETLNDGLVKFLMDRDDLHMEQDSMLVDIEDLTRYLGAKEQVLQKQNFASVKRNNNSSTPASPPSSPLSALNSTVKPHLHRIASLIKK